jgi:hypothetical protein
LLTRRGNPRSAKSGFGAKALAALIRLARASESYLPASLRLLAVVINVALWILLIHIASALAALFG